jgi:hypothetical protein
LEFPVLNFDETTITAYLKSLNSSDLTSIEMREKVGRFIFECFGIHATQVRNKKIDLPRSVYASTLFGCGQRTFEFR